MGLADAFMAETKVLRAGAFSCLTNGERIALDNVLEAIFSVFGVEMDFCE